MIPQIERPVMKKMKCKGLSLWLAAILCLTVGMLLLVGCTDTPDTPESIDGTKVVLSKTALTYNGKVLKGRVTHTFVDGKLVYQL